MDFEEMACSLFFEYYTTNVAMLHEEAFEEQMFEEVLELIMAQHDELDREEVGRNLNSAFHTFRCMVPCRTSFAVVSNPRSAPMPMYPPPLYAQRTPEWYAFRNNMITASSVAKALGSQAEINALVVEKCSPPVVQLSQSTVGPRHWGVRYEPVSVLYYEHTYQTKITEYACLAHPVYSFLGASPDGVNTVPDTPLYGRMLEIKNPVSRLITGIPKREYWIQMQVQMEVMDLEACDFLETKFVEYASMAEFYADGTFQTSEAGDRKGIILYFQKDGMYDYAYAPFGCDEEEFKRWEEDEMNKNVGRSWVTTLYWKLELVLCTLVERNRAWFQGNLSRIEAVWQIIEAERQTGAWNARLPTKRVVVSKMTAEESVSSFGFEDP